MAVTVKSTLMKCLVIIREELRICSTDYRGLTPKKGMEQAWEECRGEVTVLEDLLHAYESEPVRNVLADWQKDVMEHGARQLKLDMEDPSLTLRMAEDMQVDPELRLG